MNTALLATLDPSERVMYRKGFSRAWGLFLKKNGTPSHPDRAQLAAHAAAWHQTHDAAREAAGHKSGVSAVRSYWKRHGITDREHLLGARTRAPRMVVCDHCGERTAA